MQMLDINQVEMEMEMEIMMTMMTTMKSWLGCGLRGVMKAIILDFL
jgi:hypothetical protein